MIANQDSVIAKVLELKDLTSFSKHDSLVSGILRAIDEKLLERGDLLPSLTMMSRETGYARQTIVKAYTELKDRGIVESRNRLGYYVASETTDQTIRVALVLYAFLPFQEVFYNTFRSALGPNMQVDTFFHHNNPDVFSDIINKISGHYGMYVIAPLEHEQIAEMLEGLPEGRSLIIDRPPAPSLDIPFVSQRFEQPTQTMFEHLLPKIQRFEEIRFFFREDSDYPEGIRKGFIDFAEQHNLSYQIEPQYLPKSIEAGHLYVTISDSDLWQLLEDSVDRGLEPGVDFGILSHNDSKIKKIICGGITTISTDFETMAQRAAEYVLNREAIKEFIPTILIERKSL